MGVRSYRDCPVPHPIVIDVARFTRCFSSGGVEKVQCELNDRTAVSQSVDATFWDFSAVDSVE